MRSSLLLKSTIITLTACITVLFSPRDSFAQSYVALESLEDVIEFISNVEPVSDQGDAFVDALENWATKQTSLGSPIEAGILLDPLRTPAHLAFAGHSEVRALIASTKFGVIQYPVDTFTAARTIGDTCQATTEPNLVGICGVISAVHSLIKLKVLKPQDAIVAENLSPDILKKAKIAAGNAGTCGTSYFQENDIYEAFSGGKVKCDEDSTSLSSPSSGADACKKLEEELKKGADCRLIFNGDKRGAHSMHVTAASGSGGACEVKTYDTGVQGDGKGNGVPSVPPSQSWSVTPGNEETGAEAEITYTSGPAPEFYGPYGANTDLARFVCCRK